jgi:hypothetical protein
MCLFATDFRLESVSELELQLQSKSVIPNTGKTAAKPNPIATAMPTLTPTAAFSAALSGSRIKATGFAGVIITSGCCCSLSHG